MGFGVCLGFSKTTGLLLGFGFGLWGLVLGV